MFDLTNLVEPEWQGPCLVLMLYKLKNQYFRKEPINTNQIACMERIIVCNLLDIYILILNTWNWLRSSQKLKILHVMFWSEIF